MRRLGIAILVVMFVLPAGASAGDPSGPPTARMIVDARGQNGRLWSYCWNSGSGAVCADGVPSYAHRLRVPAGSPGTIRFPDPTPLTSASLYGYRRIRNADGYDETVDEGERLPTRIRRVLRDGERVGWRVLFHLPDDEGHLYLDLDARWTQGDAAYTFHLKLT